MRRSAEIAMAKQELHSSQLKYEDYLLFPDDGKRHEIIDGDHYVTPAPRTKHQRISANLTVALVSFVKRRRAGLVLAAPSDVILSEDNVVQLRSIYPPAPAHSPTSLGRCRFTFPVP
jgi:Uma2 family endonuclease